MREGIKVDRTAGGITSLEGQLVNSRVPEIAIYLHMYLHASFHRSGINSLCVCSALVLHKQTHIAATIDINSSGTNGQHSKGRAVK